MFNSMSKTGLGQCRQIRLHAPKVTRFRGMPLHGVRAAPTWVVSTRTTSPQWLNLFPHDFLPYVVEVIISTFGEIEL